MDIDIKLNKTRAVWTIEKFELDIDNGTPKPHTTVCNIADFLPYFIIRNWKLLNIKSWDFSQFFFPCLRNIL